jgi:hypothetical protein
MDSAPSYLIQLIPLLIVVALLLIFFLAYRRNDPGMRLGPDTIVRCRDGHLFTTIWIPFMSFKAIRLGMMRIQYCPVGRHWTTVTPVDASTLTQAELREAAQTHDRQIP